MGEKINKSLSKLKIYLTILLGCILGSLCILKSNHLNKQQSGIKLRKLSDEFCNDNEAKKLINYYMTGDLSDIDLDDGPIDYPSKNEGYTKSLMDNIENDFKDELAGEEDTCNLCEIINQIFKILSKNLSPLIVILIVSLICFLF